MGYQGDAGFKKDEVHQRESDNEDRDEAYPEEYGDEPEDVFCFSEKTDAAKGYGQNREYENDFREKLRNTQRIVCQDAEEEQHENDKDDSCERAQDANLPVRDVAVGGMDRLSAKRTLGDFCWDF